MKTSNCRLETNGQTYFCPNKIIGILILWDLIKENKPKYWFYGHYHKHYESALPNNDEFSEYERGLLMSGSLIDNTDYSSMCRFIGLDMIDRNKMDLYKK